MLSLIGFLFLVSRGSGIANHTRFQHSVWVGSTILYVSFKRLFLISEQKNQVISSFGAQELGFYIWRFSWRSSLRVWEHKLLESLIGVLDGLVTFYREDVQVQTPDPIGGFLVKVAYNFLASQVVYQIVGLSRCFMGF